MNQGNETKNPSGAESLSPRPAQVSSVEWKQAAITAAQDLAAKEEAAKQARLEQQKEKARRKSDIGISKCTTTDFSKARIPSERELEAAIQAAMREAYLA